jgi:hypothetical protein
VLADGQVKGPHQFSISGVTFDTPGKLIERSDESEGGDQQVA